MMLPHPAQVGASSSAYIDLKSFNGAAPAFAPGGVRIPFGCYVLDTWTPVWTCSSIGRNLEASQRKI